MNISPLPMQPRIAAQWMIAGSGLALLIVLLFSFAALWPQAASASEVTYRVVGVAGNDVLNVRDRPGVAGSAIVGILQPGSGGVVWTGQQQRTADGGAWWRVIHPAIPRGGWVNSRFLTEEIRQAAPEPPGSLFKDHTAHEHSYRVAGVAQNDALNIRSGPGAGNSIVGVYPPNATGVRITGRINTRPSGAVWVQVQRSDLPGGLGWVNSRFLVR